MVGRKKGTPKTGGRKKGTRNRRTAELIQAIEKSGDTPLEYMTSEYRNKNNTPAVRLQAAIAAAPYVHQKLQSLEVQSNVTMNHVVSADAMNMDEWEAKYSANETPAQDDITH